MAVCARHGDEIYAACRSCIEGVYQLDRSHSLSPTARMPRARLPQLSANADVSATGDSGASSAEQHDGDCGDCAMFDRRGFLTRASLLGLGAMVTAACGDGVIGGALTQPNPPITPFFVDPTKVTALQQVGGRAVVSPPSSGAVIVERLSSTSFRGFALACPHAGTSVDVRADGFLCPNHGARFSRDGIWQGGQPTSDLNQVAVVLQANGTLLVGGAVATPIPAAIAVSSTTISFTASSTGSPPAPQTIAVTNSGGGALTGLALTLSYAANQATGWLTLALSNAAAPASITLAASRGVLPAGTYTATVRVATGTASNGSATINVSMIVQDTNAPPALQLSTTSLAFTTTRGSSPSAQTVQLLNSGAGTLGGLAYTVAYGAGASTWLTTSSISGTTAPATLTVRPEASLLAAGTYTATITVTAIGTATRTIAVTLTVVSAGLAVTIANWPALASVGGAAGSVGNVAGVGVAVVRTGANSFAAFSMRCPHQGTTIRVENFSNTGSAFHCPNHDALWNNAGQLIPASRQRTSSLSALTVTYTAGDTVFYVS